MLQIILINSIEILVQTAIHEIQQIAIAAKRGDAFNSPFNPSPLIKRFMTILVTNEDLPNLMNALTISMINRNDSSNLESSEFFDQYCGLWSMVHHLIGFVVLHGYV